MPTLFEIMSAKLKKETPVEQTVHNPSNWKIGNLVKIDTLDYEKLIFSVKSIREIKRVIGNETFLFTDYSLTAQPFGGDPVNTILRINDNGKSVVLLNILDNFTYNKDYHDSLNWDNNHNYADDYGVSRVQEGDAIYWRVGQEPIQKGRENEQVLKDPYHATASFIEDSNNDGKINKNELKQYEFKYWDFWRQTEMYGVQVNDFYFVEMDKNGYFTILTGAEIDANRIQAL